MTNKNAFFINGSPNGWVCDSVTVVPTGLRGFVRDGHWWMDYVEAAGIVNVCIGRLGSVDWENPINALTVKTMRRDHA